MNAFLRDHGFGVALLVGAGTLAFGMIAQRLDALIIAIILLVIGVIALPLEEFALNRSGFLLKWQREAVREIQRRLEDRVTVSDSAAAEVTHVGEAGVAHPGVAAGTGHANVAAVITRPQSPDEFAETVLSQVLGPTTIVSEEDVPAPTITQSPS